MRSTRRGVKTRSRPRSYAEAAARLPAETEAGAGRWLTTREVAQVLGISRQGVFWLVSCGHLKGRKACSGVTPGGYCYAREAVEEMLRRRFIVTPVK